MQFCYANRIRTMLVLAAAAALLCSLSALGEEAVALDAIGLRYYPAPGEFCVTSGSCPAEALSLLSADQATVQAAMESDQSPLMVLSQDGTQVSLRVTARPSTVFPENVFALTPAQKEQFLTLLAREHGYFAASWLENLPGFALLTTQGASPEAAAGLQTLSLSTLYLGKIYAFQTDVMGRSLTQADTDLLLAVARRTILLGGVPQDPAAATEAAPLTLPEQPMLTTETAPVAYQLGSIPLTLSPLPALVGTTTMELSGTTAPGMGLKYSVNGSLSSRFKADVNGAFSVTMKNLDPEKPNEILVIASKGKETSTAQCQVRVDWQTTPLVVSPTAGLVRDNHFALRGLTLPGAKVQLLRGRSASPVPLQSDGSFSLDVSLPKVGENAITVRSLAPGYRRVDIPLRITRAVSAQEEVAALQRSAKVFSYEKMLQRPSAYEGRVVQYQGTVSGLANQSGQPLFLLTVGENQTVACFIADLLPVQLGQSLTLLGTLQGKNQDLETLWEKGTYPALDVAVILP